MLFGVAASGGEASRRKSGSSAELDDTFGDLVAHAPALIGCPRNSAATAFRVNPLGHEVVTFVARSVQTISVASASLRSLTTHPHRLYRPAIRN